MTVTVRYRDLDQWRKLVYWSYKTICQQRGLTFEAVGDVLGVSRQRVQQMMTVGSPRDIDRLDRAITLLTERRHRELGHRDGDPFCAVYTLSGETQPVAQAAAFREYMFGDRS